MVLQSRIRGSAGKEHGARRYQGAFELLEDRTVPSTTSVLGVNVGDVPTAQDLGLPPLVAEPVSADVQVNSALAQLFGGQPALSMFVPLPAFLTPAGTSTVTTNWTGPVTFTNFQVDNGQLNAMASQITLPDGGTPYVSPYLQSVSLQTAPTLDVVHFEMEPLALNLLGVNVALSGVDMTMSFPDVPGSSFFTGTSGASPVSVVSRGLDLFAEGLGIAQQKVNEVVGGLRLPAPLSTVVERLAPATSGTVPVADYQLAATQIDGQTITIGLAQGANVSVSDTTGADELLGNLLADAISLEDKGEAAIDALRNQLETDLQSISPFDLLKDILANLEFPGMFPGSSLIETVLADLFVPALSSGDLTTVADQADRPDLAGGSAGLSGGIWGLYGRNTVSGYGGFGASSSGAAGGARIHIDNDGESEVVVEDAPAHQWDESPLPQVLPDLNPPGLSGPLSPQSTHETSAAVSSRQTPPGSEVWARTLAQGMAWTTTALIAAGCTDTPHSVPEESSDAELRCEHDSFADELGGALLELALECAESTDLPDSAVPSVVEAINVMALWALGQYLLSERIDVAERLRAELRPSYF